MKTNYKVLIFTFFINIFMALSLNSFTSPALYLPMMFLYFLSGLASFVDKISFYKGTGQKAEEGICWICFFICLLGACFYTADSLDFIEITFQSNCGTYKVLMQGVQNSFFTFNSINVTPLIFFVVFILPFAYPVLCMVSYLREQGLTWKKIRYICKHNILRLFALLFLSVIIGFAGAGVCQLKYIKTSNNYGIPQYHKYFIVAFILCLFISYTYFFLRHRNDDLGQSHQQEEHPYTSEQKHV